MDLRNIKSNSYVSQKNYTVKAREASEQSVASGQPSEYTYLDDFEKTIMDKFNPSTKTLDINTLHNEKSEELKHTVTNALERYYAGECSDEELQKAFSDVYKELLSVNIEQGRISGTQQDKEKMLYELYYDTISLSLNRAEQANWNEGKELANQYGDATDKDWVYYDAKYYHMAEKSKDIFQSVVTELEEEHGLDQIDTETIKNSPLNNFNRNWSWKVESVMYVGEMMDINAVPPKDFKFFYKESQYSASDFENGETIYVGAKNKFATNENHMGNANYAVKIPKGHSLIKADIPNIWDYLNQHTDSTGRKQINIEAFMGDYNAESFMEEYQKTIDRLFNTYNQGVLIIESDDGVTTDYPITENYDGTRNKYNGGDFSSSDYAKNFNFHNQMIGVENLRNNFNSHGERYRI